MAIFANGPATQTATVGTATGTVPIFNTTATGVSGTLKNVMVINTGSNTIYVGGGTAVTSATGMPVAAGQTLLLLGTPVNLYACTASGTSVSLSGLATQALAD